jgi:integrase
VLPRRNPPLPVHKLTIQVVQQAIPIEGRETIYRDTEVTGLSLKVTPSHNRIFFYQYRVGGRGTPTKKIKIGKFPATKPDEARRIAMQYAAELARKEDPHRRLKSETEARQLAAQNSFEAVFEIYAAKRLSQNRSGKSVTRVFNRDFIPALGRFPLADITRADISKIITAIYDRDAPYAANRALSFIKTFFRWTLGQGYIQGDPTSGMQRPFRGETARDRVLTPDEIKTLWREFSKLGYPFAPALKALMMTAQRRDEVGSMCWENIDPQSGYWSISREVTKNKLPHLVPLPTTVLDAIEPLVNDEGEKLEKKGLVFTTTGSTPISGWSKIKRRITESLEKQDITLADWRFHDFRRTASSALGDMGYRDQDIAMLLNHQNRGVTAVYNRSQYTALKTKMLHGRGSVV